MLVNTFVTYQLPNYSSSKHKAELEFFWSCVFSPCYKRLIFTLVSWCISLALQSWKSKVPNQEFQLEHPRLPRQPLSLASNFPSGHLWYWCGKKKPVAQRAFSTMTTIIKETPQTATKVMTLSNLKSTSQAGTSWWGQAEEKLLYIFSGPHGSKLFGCSCQASSSHWTELVWPWDPVPGSNSTSMEHPLKLDFWLAKSEEPNQPRLQNPRWLLCASTVVKAVLPNLCLNKTVLCTGLCNFYLWTCCSVF